MERDGVHPLALYEHFDCVDRQGRHFKFDLGARTNVTKSESQWMFVANLVLAIATNEENGQVANAPPDHAHEIQRRLVCPVQVLEYHDAGRGERFPQERQKSIKDLVPVHRFERTSQGTVDLGDDVDQRSERPSGHNGVARTPEDASIPGPIGAERVEESGLPNAGLSPDKDNPPSSMPAFQQQGA